jgi:hypothetical protein
LFLRKYIINYNAAIIEIWKYGMPFYCYQGKMFCYLWVHKKTHNPYPGIVEGKKIEHPLLIIEKRARMKIMQIVPEQDIPVEAINEILGRAIKLFHD